MEIAAAAVCLCRRGSCCSSSRRVVESGAGQVVPSNHLIPAALLGRYPQGYPVHGSARHRLEVRHLDTRARRDRRLFQSRRVNLALFPQVRRSNLTLTEQIE